MNGGVERSTSATNAAPIPTAVVTAPIVVAGSSEGKGGTLVDVLLAGLIRDGIDKRIA